MSEVKLVWRTDVHTSDTAPSSRKDDWMETVLGKLGQVRDAAAGASAILDGGDFFHVKAPGRNSHELVRRVADHHATYPCPVFCTPGNHDSVYGDYGFLGQQPLGVLFSTGVFKRLYDEHEVYFGPGDDSVQVGVYPYNRKGTGWVRGTPFGKKSDGPVVRVVGIPYHGTAYDMGRFHAIEKGEEDILICVAHVLASREGGTMFEGEDIVKYGDLLGSAPDVFCFGHWHKDQGVAKLGGKTFINIGSLTRGSLSQDEVRRQPACAVLSCTKAGVEVEVVRLKVASADEVFDIERREKEVQRQNDMDTFVSNIRETLQKEADEKADLAAIIREQGKVPEEVRERAQWYLEQVDR